MNYRIAFTPIPSGGKLTCGGTEWTIVLDREKLALDGNMGECNSFSRVISLYDPDDMATILHELLEMIKVSNGLASLEHPVLSTLAVGLGDVLRQMGIQLKVTPVILPAQLQS